MLEGSDAVRGGRVPWSTPSFSAGGTPARRQGSLQTTDELSYEEMLAIMVRIWNCEQLSLTVSAEWW